MLNHLGLKGAFPKWGIFFHSKTVEVQQLGGKEACPWAGCWMEICTQLPASVSTRRYNFINSEVQKGPFPSFGG